MTLSHKLGYVCLQATRQGQASYAHVHEIVRGLEALGWTIRLFEPEYAHTASSVSLARKLVEFARVQLRCAVQMRRLEIVYVRDHPGVLPLIAWCRLLRKPVVLEVNGPYDELALSYPGIGRLMPLLAAMFRARARWSTCVIAVTPELGLWIEMKARLTRPVDVVGNGADPGLFTPRPPCDESYVVFVGALAVWQGIDVLLAAASDPAWPRDIRIRIAGHGVEERRVIDATASLKHVEYLGTVEYERVPLLVAESRASVIAKNDRGDRALTGLSPLKLYEAMSCGVPVIVTDLPGLRDVVDEARCGIIIPLDDATSLVNAVRWLRDNREQASAMGRAGREAVISRYSWEAAARKTAAILDEARGASSS